MNKLILIVLLLSTTALCSAQSDEASYTAVIEGFDWGAGVSKVILPVGAAAADPAGQEYTVFVRRHHDCVAIPKGQRTGQREVIHRYVSGARGEVASDGQYVTLVLAVAPNDPLGSPIQYSGNEQCPGNNWIDYELVIVEESTGRIWHTETDRIMPLIDRFDLSGTFAHHKIRLTYASYTPAEKSNASPLIIWLHGGGEGGTDPSIPLVANRAANYASDELQTYFGGAYVLIPQTPTRWMDDGQGGTTRGEVDDMYHEALFALIEQFVADHPDIDQDRIYVGGCSNGGYMTLKLILEHPDYFAAAFPSALAYFSAFLTDAQIESIKAVPIWFVHAKDDRVTVPGNTVLPIHRRLQAAGADNLHFSFFDHVVDITGLFGGEGYHYSGHWSWIYCHANVCRRDVDGSPVLLDGRPVTIMEWLAAQSQ